MLFAFGSFFFARCFWFISTLNSEIKRWFCSWTCTNLISCSRAMENFSRHEIVLDYEKLDSSLNILRKDSQISHSNFHLQSFAFIEEWNRCELRMEIPFRDLSSGDETSWNTRKDEWDLWVDKVTLVTSTERPLPWHINQIHNLTEILSKSSFFTLQKSDDPIFLKVTKKVFAKKRWSHLKVLLFFLQNVKLPSLLSRSCKFLSRIFILSFSIQYSTSLTSL